MAAVACKRRIRATSSSLRLTLRASVGVSPFGPLEKTRPPNCRSMARVAAWSAVLSSRESDDGIGCVWLRHPESARPNTSARAALLFTGPPAPVEAAEELDRRRASRDLAARTSLQAYRGAKARAWHLLD